ncbi:hypothetical protein L226DRAFT_538377 [Lentinus tigrinus ALCF2SS1-7]|uniref:Uncharacterized protein n=1 Tax=Lentinus tigrinus ALCF2SS1-6 TaxID=1328759 RepID=A0A5C2RYR8_9APHY|nr:hypothetical protein L227DRAFT_281416 [Lentinus tigrinus ALCF2SS1-6]RPD71003.1 hypothetical protein L226DRAFT_538377 [Lentinus tigrinus ALCF2SS1-7]
MHELEDLIYNIRIEYRKTAASVSQDSLLKSIDAVTNFLADLREHLNDFAPIHRLPPELLSLIFSTQLPRHHKNIFDSDRNSVNVYHHAHGWNALFARICRRWRAAALDTPEPWAYISAPPDSNQFRIHMERSQAHQLSLSIGTHIPDLEKVLRSVGLRLCRLDVAITTRPVEAIKPSSILQIDAPQLRCATFMCAREKFSSDTGGRSGPEVEWVELFGQPSCSLRALALALATNWLPSNTFADLTHLLLSCNPHLAVTSHSGLLALLCNTPRLEFLHIIHLWYHASDVNRSGVRMVALNRLRSLVVDTCTRISLLSFYARLTIPAHTLITLVEIVVGTAASAVPLLDESSPVTCLEINIDGSKLQVIAKSALRDFLLQWRSGGIEGMQTGPPLHRLLSLSAVTSLKVSFGSGHGLYVIDDLVPHLSQVSEVAIYHCYIGGTRYDESPYDTPAVFFDDLGRDGACPALSLLTVYLRLSTAELIEEDPVLYGVSEMLRARALSSASLPRVVVQPHARDPFTTQELEHIREWFTGYTAELELREAAIQVRPDPSEPAKRWMSDGAERYWHLYDRAKPEYLGPHGGDSSERWIAS